MAIDLDKVLTIAQHEYWVNVRRPDFIIVTLLVPALGLIALIAGVFFGRQTGGAIVRLFDDELQHTALVDQSGRFTPMLPQFEEEFIVFDDEPAARAALEEETVVRVIIVPAAYPEQEDVRVISAGSRFSGSGTGGLRSFFMAHLVQEIGDAGLRERLLDPYDAHVEFTSEADEEPGGVVARVLGYVVPFIFAILLTVTIFISSGYLIRSVAEEKSSRVIEIVLSSVTPQQLLAGKVIGLGGLGLTQVFVWLGSALGLGGGLALLAGIVLPFFTRGEVFALALLYYILGFTVYAVLIAAIGTLGSNSQESQQISGIVTLFAAIPLMFLGVFLNSPDSILVRALSWFPLTAPTSMMLRLPLGDIPWVDVAVSICVLLASTPLIVWLGAKIFRLGMLMYGKRPGILELVRLLRHA